ncbi:hypothetical protein JXB11_02930 [Candidatus Woesearchaeota archaeon]|nr:hypothetical protein [Candidatus Woesearchaeota archaeon]
MGEKSVITTGVDKLVQLVMQKRRVGIDEAAKSLQVPKVLIEEWADFLEEREVIGIEYKFAKPFLVYKELSKQETKQLSKQFVGRKEGFVRKVDSVLQYLEQESDGIRRLKEEMDSMTKEIDSKVGHVKDELRLLADYEAKKKAVDTRIVDQEKKFESKRDRLTKQIEANKRSVNQYLQFVEEKEKELTREEKLAKELMQKETVLEKKLLAQAADFEKKVEGDREKMTEVMKKIAELNMLSEKLEVDIGKQKQAIGPLLAESKKYEEEVAAIRKKFVDKLSSSKGKGAIKYSDIKRIRDDFNRLFGKKSDAEKLVTKLNKDVDELKKEFRDLSNEAMVVKLSSKSKKVAEYLKEFESKFDKLEAKKKSFGKEVQALSSILKKI